MGLIPAWGRPLEKENGNPLQYSCLKKSHRQSLAFTVCGGHKESYTIEQLMHALKMEAIYKP